MRATRAGTVPMGNRKRTSRNLDAARLTVAVGVSLTLHALLAALWIVNPPILEPSDNPNKAQAFVRFGIDQSQHKTIAWLGFIDPTPHQAPLSTTDQSALSPEISQAQPSESASAASAAAAVRFVEVGSAAKASLSRLVAQSRLALVQLLESAAKRATEAQPAPEDPKEARNTEEQAEPVEPTEHAESTDDGPNADESKQPASTSPPAIKSPKESDAVSRDTLLEYRNGRVASRQGLDITTVRPKWVNATLLTANPRNPHVRIEFGSDGKVKKAEFEGKGTGYETVDHILLNAIYAWTASGKEIDDLKESNPKSVVIARVRIRLR